MERIKACNGSEKQSETYELILIGGDSGEYRLWEYEGLVRFLFEVCYRLGGARLRSLHQVNPRLIFVHRVQHQLEIVTSRSEDSQRVVSLSTRLKINDRTAFKSNESLLPLPSRNLRERCVSPPSTGIDSTVFGAPIRRVSRLRPGPSRSSSLDLLRFVYRLGKR